MRDLPAHFGTLPDDELELDWCDCIIEAALGDYTPDELAMAVAAVVARAHAGGRSIVQVGRGVQALWRAMRSQVSPSDRRGGRPTRRLPSRSELVRAIRGAAKTPGASVLLRDLFPDRSVRNKARQVVRGLPDFRAVTERSGKGGVRVRYVRRPMR